MIYTSAHIRRGSHMEARRNELDDGTVVSVGSRGGELMVFVPDHELDRWVTTMAEAQRLRGKTKVPCPNTDCTLGLVAVGQENNPYNGPPETITGECPVCYGNAWVSPKTAHEYRRDEEGGVDEEI